MPPDGNDRNQEPFLLFVYGTLKRDGILHHYLGDSKFVAEGRAVGFDLFDLGGCPAMKIATGPDMWIRSAQGEIYEITDLAVLNHIMQVECANYRPRMVSVSDLKKNHYTCWAFEYLHETDPASLVLSGRWTRQPLTPTPTKARRSTKARRRGR